MKNIEQMNEEELRDALRKSVELLEQMYSVSFKYRQWVNSAIGDRHVNPRRSGQMGAIK